MRRLLPAALLLLPFAARAAAVCPAAQDGRPLRNVMLFDGPPPELASLVPREQGRRVVWDVEYIRKAGRRGYLVCSYAGAAQPLQAEVPAGSRACSFTFGAGERIVGPVDCR